jgi:hypothetical protein
MTLTKKNQVTHRKITECNNLDNFVYRVLYLYVHSAIGSLTGPHLRRNKLHNPYQLSIRLFRHDSYLPAGVWSSLQLGYPFYRHCTCMLDLLRQCPSFCLTVIRFGVVVSLLSLIAVLFSGMRISNSAG